DQAAGAGRRKTSAASINRIPVHGRRQEGDMRAATATTVSARVGAWYGDQDLALDVPGTWDIDIVAPSTPPPIGDTEIRAAIEAPVGQAPLRETARGKRRPLIVVDDLTRPTPTDAVI